MILFMKTLSNTKASQDAFPTTPGAFAPIMVVYKLPQGGWKGFVQPYGETTEATTKQAAVKQLRELTAAYQDMTQEYGNPRHLVHAGLGDSLDREVFAWVFGNKEIMEKLHSKAGKADSDTLYVEAYRH